MSDDKATPEKPLLRIALEFNNGLMRETKQYTLEIQSPYFTFTGANPLMGGDEVAIFEPLDKLDV